MTEEEAKEVTEIVKEKLKENGDIYSEHILAYVSYLETQIEKMKNCENCRFVYDKKHDCMPCENMEDWELME